MKLHTTIILAVFALTSACSSGPKQPTLSDLKSRYWKGTYYLSVTESPTSIKCSIDASYQSTEDVPVVYQGKDASEWFTRQDDQTKILKLKQQCLDKSREVYQSER